LRQYKKNINNHKFISVVNILQQWITLFPDDWAQDSKLRNKARTFLDANATYSTHFESLANQISQTKRQFVQFYGAWEIERTRMHFLNTQNNMYD